MNSSGHIQFSPAAFYRIGSVAFHAAFTLGVAVTFYVTWQFPDAAIFIPLVFLGLLCGWILFRHPLVNLAVVLASFVLIVDFDEGIQITEALYGLYYLSFLAHWFVTRIFLMRRSIFERKEDRVLSVFLLLMTLSVILTVLFGGKLVSARGEWLSLSLLAFYFPVREAIVKDRRGLYVILGVLGWVGLYVLLRNVLNFKEILLSATYAYQITHGRAVTNEGLLLAPALIALVFFIFSDRWSHRIPSAVAFLAFMGGLLLTQSRGYWLAFLAGALALLFVIKTRYKVRLLSSGVFFGALTLGLAVLFLGDFVLLVASGIIDRIFSIADASTSDISLVNRFLETKAVFGKILQNPILGYGMGVPYSVYDITYELTLTKSFAHNGYIALWYKFGIWGLGMVIFFFGTILYRSLRVFRFEKATWPIRLCGLAVFCCFAALAVSANTSNPFYMNDLMFLYALLSGLGGGCYTLALSKAVASSATDAALQKPEAPGDDIPDISGNAP